MREEIEKIYDEVVQNLTKNKDKIINKILTTGDVGRMDSYLLQDNETILHIMIRLETLSRALPTRVILGDDK